METKLKKQIKAHTIKMIKELTKQLEENAIDKIDKALNSGALSEDSEFLKMDNSLLARAILDHEAINIKLQYPAYKKEANNLQLFL